MISLKSPKEVEALRMCGGMVASVLDLLEKEARPGLTTKDLDILAEEHCRSLGAEPAFLGYQGFTGSVCTSVNQEVVHGLPDRKIMLKDGDILSFDFGVCYQGWFGDSARSVRIGGSREDEVDRLLEVTKGSLEAGIQAALVGHTVGDIGAAVQNVVENAGFSVVRDFVGHGIGRALHEDPQVPNFGPAGKGPKLKPGMVLAIEPMVNMGKPDVRILKDGWTVVTVDGSLSAHFEHMVAITASGPDVLSRPKNPV
jgi:methionyl aminopeptidase